MLTRVHLLHLISDTLPPRGPAHFEDYVGDGADAVAVTLLACAVQLREGKGRYGYAPFALHLSDDGFLRFGPFAIPVCIVRVETACGGPACFAATFGHCCGDEWRTERA
jgi:hypothetical protein